VAMLSRRGEVTPMKEEVRPGPAVEQAREGNGAGPGEAQGSSVETGRAKAARQARSVAEGPRTTHKLLKVRADKDAVPSDASADSPARVSR